MKRPEAVHASAWSCPSRPEGRQRAAPSVTGHHGGLGLELHLAGVLAAREIAADLGSALVNGAKIHGKFAAALGNLQGEAVPLLHAHVVPAPYSARPVMGVLAEAHVVLLGDLDIGPGLREAAHAAVEAIFRNLHAPVEENARTGAGKRFVRSQESPKENRKTLFVGLGRYGQRKDGASYALDALLHMRDHAFWDFTFSRNLWPKRNRLGNRPDETPAFIGGEACTNK